MDKLWIIAKQEFLIRVKKRSFLLGALVVPLLFAALITITIIIIERTPNDLAIGYIDYSGLLIENVDRSMWEEEEDEPLTIKEFSTEADAQGALSSGEITAYFIVSNEDLEKASMALYYWDEVPPGNVFRNFDNFIRANIVSGKPSLIQKRIVDGHSVVVRNIDGSREFSEDIGFIAFLFPIIIAMFFVFVAMSTSGYFLHAMTDERENMSVEILITSVSPNQLIGGKSLGLFGVALTLLAIWTLTVVIAYYAAGLYFPELMDVKLPLDILWLLILFFVPTFILIGGMMTAIGSIGADYRESQQISGFLNLLFTFPLFLFSLVLGKPDHPLLIALTFFPTTSFITTALRWSSTFIPWWHIALSLMLLILSATGMIWLAARLFHTSMLRYGQRLSWKKITKTLKSNER